MPALRSDFPFLSRTISGKPIIYFDNAATSQKPRQIVDTLSDFYSNGCANIHRGVHSLSLESTEQYNEARRRVARFINADEREIVFVRNTTEAINLVGRCLRGPGTILSSVSEHHSNLLPWSASRKLRHYGMGSDGRTDMGNLKRKLDGDVLLVAVSHISNVLGLVNPIRDVIAEAKSAGALCMVDAAQSVPHMPIDVKKLDCDFLAFSGHKMLAPTGIGVLYVRSELYDRMDLHLIGGNAAKEVHTDGFVAENPPQCYESGTPNIEGAIALSAATQYLSAIGMDNIRDHDHHLVEYAMDKMLSINKLKVYGTEDCSHRQSVITFNLTGVDCHAVARILNHRENIMVRSGFHCAQPLHEVLGSGQTVRVSFYLYNTKAEIDRMIPILERISDFM